MLFSLMPITVDAHTSARLSKVLINALSAMLSAIFVCVVSVVCRVPCRSMPMSHGLSLCASFLILIHDDERSGSFYPHAPHSTALVVGGRNVPTSLKNPKT